MKAIYKFSSLLFLTAIFLFAGRPSAMACVQVHDSVYVSVHYAPGNTDVSITLSNLRLATGTPNEFCSCGITNMTSIFTTILYVAFVDSGTTNPYPGFDVWDPSVPASNAWNTVLATNDWSAFVSHVNAGGLTFNHPVELIIRAASAPGITYQQVDSALYVSQLGTDAYDNTNQVLGNMHQDISGFQGPHTLIPEGPGSTYFATLDAALMTARTPTTPQSPVEIYPVPAVDRLYVDLHNPLNALRQIAVYDATGKRIHQESGLNGQRATVDVAALPQGFYFIKVSTANGVQTKRFLKAD
jgi:Secretion system C-terminal sorting domain